MEFIICILLIMLLWNIIKMIKAQTESIKKGNKRHKRR